MKKRKMDMKELYRICLEHQRWLDTDGQEGVQADLSYVRLHGKDFRKIGKGSRGYTFLTEMKFVGADISGCSFENYQFTGCDFSEVDFSHSKFSNCMFTQCKLPSADFSHAGISNCDFIDCDFTKASFHDAGFGSGVSSVVKAYSTFSHCNLNKTNFKSAMFEDIKMSCNHMDQTSFRDIHSSGVCMFAGNRISRLGSFESNFSNCVFENNDFTDTIFIRCIFDQALFRQCRFDEKSNILNCNVEHCDFQNTDFPKHYDKIDYIYDYDPQKHKFLHDVLAYNPDSNEVSSRRLAGAKNSTSLTMLIHTLKNVKPESQADKLVKQLLLKKFEEIAVMYQGQKESRSIIDTIKKKITEFSKSDSKGQSR